MDRRLALLLAFTLVLATTSGAEHPEVRDPIYELTLFAESPAIVTPTGAIFDRQGRLLVIESHTHFRPDEYEGPAHDRIRVIEDTDRDGRADRFTTFFEGLTHAMALAIGPDGSVFVATRGSILRLRDADQDGVADQDEAVEIVKLDTAGNYPHNGLCGLTFDREGRLWFGLGENLGEPYTLIGSDGAKLKGGGEGGNIYWCLGDGSNLNRVATGFWNPFGLCIDPAGRLFCVDNDPDKTPYCRLLHIVPGADFGYQYRYGRTGTHPLQAWEGELPGTLPMVASTGEAPCAVIPFDGQLWVTSWGNNRLERFDLKAQGASWSATLDIVVQGDPSFRPVDFALAADGSVFITDWGSASYPVNGLGRVWRLARKPDPTGEVPLPLAWPTLSREEQFAARRRARPELNELFTQDLFLWQATVWGLIQHGLPDDLAWGSLLQYRQRLGVLAVARWSGRPAYRKFLGLGLRDVNAEVRLAAVRWVADHNLVEHRPDLERIATRANPDSPLGKGVAAALEHLKQ